ncbi:MAG: pilus assembly protein TadG-related protein [Terriglobales bacterium]
MIAVAMVAVLAMAGLALDIGRLVGDKSRLQATVDVAALSAAKVLDTTGSTVAATAAATSTFNSNIALQSELPRVGGTMAVEFSNTLVPFAPGTNPPLYVQVSATGFFIPATLSAVVGFTFFDLNASAMAGPSPTLNNACNLASMMICGTPGAPQNGYAVGQITALQPSTGTPATTGVGYFLQQSSGAHAQDQDYAGAYNACSTVGTNAPGQTAIPPAPVADGLNTRFGEYATGDVNSGSYPPDAVTTQPAGADRLKCTTLACTNITTVGGTPVANSSQYPLYNYENMYQPAVRAGAYTNPPAPAGNGVVDRRVLAVPVANCAAAAGGGNAPVIGLACMFMLQDVDPITGQVFTEAVSSCEVNGNPGPVPNNGPGPYTIELYHVPGSTQS